MNDTIISSFKRIEELKKRFSQDIFSLGEYVSVISAYTAIGVVTKQYSLLYLKNCF